MAESVKAAPGIYRAIAGVIADVGSVAKDRINKQQGFKFRSIDDVYNALHPALAKNKVFIVPQILNQEREVVGTTKNGAKMTLVICKIKFSFFAEDGSSVEAIIVGEGLDTGDKATNKAMAIAYKYACFQVFCIPTEDMDDPDEECPEELLNNKAEKEKTSSKNSKEKANDKAGKEEGVSPKTDKITEAMLNTIHAEQKRTGVTDRQILSRKEVKAKTVEDMTVTEFEAIMKVFEITKDLKGGSKDE